MKIRIAVTPPASALRAEVFSDYLRAAEQLGFDTLWLSDIPLGALGDPLVSLTFAAARTARMKLGANLVPLGRNPWWLAKQLAQLDQLSHGRLLLSFVPGLGTAAERAALGHTRGDRGVALEHIIALLRQWWAGLPVTATYADFRFDNVSLSPTPRQTPLEIWLGGVGPLALRRVARCGDGWLTAAATPDEAAAGCASILRESTALQRFIDPEHFGISIPFARAEPTEVMLSPLRSLGLIHGKQERRRLRLSQLLTIKRIQLPQPF